MASTTRILRRRTAVAGMGAAAAVVALAGAAFACTPLVGTMVVATQDPNHITNPNHLLSVGVGGGPAENMAFCQTLDNDASGFQSGIRGGAVSRKDPQKVRIAVAPATCPIDPVNGTEVTNAATATTNIALYAANPANWTNGTDSVDAFESYVQQQQQAYTDPAQNVAGNFLPPDTAADINFRDAVFGYTSGVYTYRYPYDASVNEDCMTGADLVISAGTMVVSAGVGSAEVTVPAGLTDAALGVGDSAGVCVDATLQTQLRTVRRLSMAPLWVSTI